MVVCGYFCIFVGVKGKALSRSHRHDRTEACAPQPSSSPYRCRDGCSCVLQSGVSSKVSSFPQTLYVSRNPLCPCPQNYKKETIPIYNISTKVLILYLFSLFPRIKSARFPKFYFIFGFAERLRERRRVGDGRREWENFAREWILSFRTNGHRPCSGEDKNSKYICFFAHLVEKIKIANIFAFSLT